VINEAIYAWRMATKIQQNTSFAVLAIMLWNTMPHSIGPSASTKENAIKCVKQCRG